MTDAVGTVARELLDRIPERPVQIRTMKVVLASPLQVELDGDTASVRAVSLTGASLAVDATGYAIWQPPLPPMVFATSGSTGWSSSGISYGSGFSGGTPGQLQYRVEGTRVTLRGGADRGAPMTDGGTVATLPAAVRPSTNLHFMCFGASRRAVAIDIRTNGEIWAGYPDPPGSGGTSSIHDPWPANWVGIDVSYYTD
jgi:hypothetical protein